MTKHITEEQEHKNQDSEDHSTDNDLSISHDNDQPSLDFYGLSLQTDGDVPIAASERFVVHKKLEVATAKKINSMARWYNVTCLLGFVLSLTVVILSRTKFSIFQEGFPGIIPDVIVYDFPKALTLFDVVIAFAAFCFAFLLLLAYSIIIFRSRRKGLLNEQIWVVGLLVSTVLYLIPYEAALRIRRDIQEIPLEAHEDGLSISHIFVCLRLISFSVLFILYPWMGAHCYRYLGERISFRDMWFYLPKLILVSTYVVLKLAILFIFRVTFSELPFASLIAMIYIYPAVGSWSALGIVSVSIVTITEIILTILIVIDFFRTFKTLQNVEYVRYRTQVLGFRFFLHQLFVFGVIYSCIYFLVLFGLPNGIQVIQFSLLSEEGTGRGSYFDIQYAPFGLTLCIIAYVTVEAYTNLPAACDPIKSLFRSPQDEVTTFNLMSEPISYKNTEPRSGTGETIPFLANCFVMETNVNLLNLSWYAYYHGTQKEKNLNVDLRQGPLKISESLYDEATDTKTIIAESVDRIFLVFKGTSSTQNLKTDIKVMHCSLVNVLGQEAGSSSENSPQPKVESSQSKLLKRAKVHQGFANAYKTVQPRLRQIIANLIQKKKRPLFFTGHSLGGALATLSSLDIRISTGVDEASVHVTTFGSPRVGNEAFQEFYDTHVPTNWRVVAGGDLISRLPTVGYVHVGKQVILTSTGELFIDPNILEILFWHSQSASIVHHRKACYMLALKAWCESLGGDYIPQFWPFQISENDNKLFQNTFKKPKSATLTSRISRRKQKEENRQERFQLFAEAINALDESGQNFEKSIGSWAKLTTLLLQKNKTDQRES